MKALSILPVVTAAIAGMIAIWSTSRKARNLLGTYNGKSRAALLKQHRPAIWIADALFLVGLWLGAGLYRVGGFANSDLRPLLWSFGLASVLPLVALAVVSAISGGSPKEAYVVFSLGQGSPLWITYGILGVGVLCFCLAVASLVT